MNSPLHSSGAEELASKAKETADEAMNATLRLTNVTLDKIQDNVSELRDQMPGILSRAAGQVEHLAHRGADRVRQAQQTARGELHKASDSTSAYVKDEPLKAVLIALAAGVALGGLLSLWTRPPSDR